MTTDEREFIAEAVSRRRAQVEQMTQRRSALQVMVKRLDSFIYGVSRELELLLDVKDIVPEPGAVELEMPPSDFRNMLL